MGGIRCWDHHARRSMLKFLSQRPKTQKNIIKTMEKLPDMLTPILETIEWLAKIKASGHKLYYLSNYHKVLSRYVQDEYSFFRLFDGGAFSCMYIYLNHLLKYINTF